jgi:hypothetical protein
VKTRPAFWTEGSDIELSSRQVLESLGCAPPRKPSARLRRQIEKAIQCVADAAACRMERCSHPMRVRDGRVCVADEVALRGEKLAQAFGGCREIHVYVVTLGPDVDRLIDHWMRTRPDFGVVVDTVASLAAESLVERVEQEVSQGLPPAAALSLPFSPGHCDWPVREQQQLFDLLPDDPAGVRLSADFMMSPRKSVSGVLGVGPVAAVIRSRNPCAGCNRSGCSHRRFPYIGRHDARATDRRAGGPRRGRPAPFSVPTA